MRRLEDLQPVHRYLELKAELQRLQDELDTLKPVLYDALTDEPPDGPSGKGRFIHAGFEFTTGIRRTWKYSESTEALTDELRSRKRREERDGTAKIIRVTGYVICKAIPKPPTECEVLPFFAAA